MDSRSGGAGDADGEAAGARRSAAPGAGQRAFDARDPFGERVHVAPHFRQFGPDRDDFGMQIGTDRDDLGMQIGTDRLHGSRQGVDAGVDAVKATALRQQQRHQNGQQRHPDSDDGDRFVAHPHRA